LQIQKVKDASVESARKMDRIIHLRTRTVTMERGTADREKHEYGNVTTRNIVMAERLEIVEICWNGIGCVLLL